ncbi:MAG: glutamate synthase subunit beta [Solirubrobacteraceae bacterium]|nr:glutamate synthase subunit beta [Solirubrobacteraceae bacterium]
MGELGAFLKIDRSPVRWDDPAERAGRYTEFVVDRPPAEVSEQGARCMECGVPFCHNGCPLGNLIPDWNDLVYRGEWQQAIRQLHATNNFPEFTGRVCPAPCEAACVLEINEGDAVTIKQIEHTIIDRAWAEGWVVPEPPTHETGQRVAVVGAGPAGLAAAQQLRRAGHAVVLFERDEAAGGLIRFGVPDFKIEKHVVQRRVDQLVAEGVELRCGVEVGVDVTADELRAEFDAVVLTVGSRVPRDLPVEGRDLEGVHYAMEYLYERTRWAQHDQGVPIDVPGGGWESKSRGISARGKHVVVIGGGDTGADCVAQSIREDAASVVQVELLPEPPATRPDDRTPWPLWPAKFRLSYAMEEARAIGRGVQTFSVSTLRLEGDEDGRVARFHYAQAEPAPPFGPVPGTEQDAPAQLVLLAMGFLHPEPRLLDGFGLAKDARGNIKAGAYATSEEGVFAAGDCRRGQSLIVWAINEGRQAARVADRYLARKAGRAARPSALAGV